MRSRRTSRIKEFREGILPMAQKEMRSFMRGWRAPVALFCCTAVVSAIVLLDLYLLSRSLEGFYQTEELARIGRQLFYTLTGWEFGLVAVIVPMLTAGVISGEHRRGTMEGLLLTRLTGRDIVQGKLLAALGFFAVLLLCLLPVISVITWVGGVSPWEVLLVHLLLFATAYCTGAFGVLCSARFPNGPTAYVVAYLITVSMLTCLFPFTAALPLVIFMVRNPGERQGCVFFMMATAGGVVAFLYVFPWVLALLAAFSPITAFLALFTETEWLFPGAWCAASLVTIIFLRLLGRGLLGIAAELVRPPHIGLRYFKGAFTRRANSNWDE
ncbi:MAG: ABC transporter permease [Armatimonadota bacterium]